MQVRQSKARQDKAKHDWVKNTEPNNFSPPSPLVVYPTTIRWLVHTITHNLYILFIHTTNIHQHVITNVNTKLYVFLPSLYFHLSTHVILCTITIHKHTHIHTQTRDRKFNTVHCTTIFQSNTRVQYICIHWSFHTFVQSIWTNARY